MRRFGESWQVVALAVGVLDMRQGDHRGVLVNQCEYLLWVRVEVLIVAS